MTVLLNIKTPLLAERNSLDKVLDECSGEGSLCAYFLLTFFPRHSCCHRITQSHWRVAEVRSSSLTPLFRQGHLELVAQNSVHFCFEYLHDLSGHPVPVFDDPHNKKVFLMFRGNLICACCLLSCQWAPLRGVRLPHLLSLSYDTYTHW